MEGTEELRQNSIYNKVVKIIESVSTALNKVAIVILIAMMLITVADVSLRYFFSSPITGATEITESLMALLGFLGLAYCAMKDGHLKVDLIMSHFPQRVQAIIDGIELFAGLIICVIIAWRAFLEGVELHRLNMQSSLLEIPQFPFFWIMSLGFSILALVMITGLIKYIIKAVNG